MELSLALAVGRSGRRAAPEAAMLHAAPHLPPSDTDYTPARKYADERRVLGLSTGPHILSLYRPKLAGLTDADSRQLPRRVGRHIRIAGVLEACRTTTTQTGKTIAFLTLDDEFGLFEVTAFPDACRGDLRFNRYGPWLVAGTVEDQYGAILVAAQRISRAKTNDQ